MQALFRSHMPSISPVWQSAHSELRVPGLPIKARAGPPVIVEKNSGAMPLFFLLDAAWVRSRAERPSVSYTKVTAKSQGQAISCKHTSKSFKQISGNNKFLIAGDGKMKRMREP